MKTIVLGIVAALGLCACATGSDMQSYSSSYTVNGVTYSGMNLNDPHFYMKDSEPNLQGYELRQRPSSVNYCAPGVPCTY
ncbi:MAG TPA: hypothetical protein VEG25_00450 [Burkholderiales bacterium]|nr:hypothetical protein [Burkholderiales bacterium]